MSSKQDVSGAIACAKNLIQITSVETSTSLAMLSMMPHLHTSLSKITRHKTK